MNSYSLMIVSLVGLFVVNTAHADVIVSQADVIDGAYRFSLGLNDVGPGTNAFDKAVSSRINVLDELETFTGNPTRYVRAAPDSSFAEFIIRWDFSSTSLRPTGASFDDNLFLFRFDTLDLVQATTAWSIDGVVYSPIKSLESSGIVVSDQTVNSVTFSSAATEVWYRVTFEVLPGDNNGVFDRFQNQWGRSSDVVPGLDETVFGVTFISSNGCSADLAEPFGVLNFFDLLVYIDLFNASDLQADLTSPFSVINFFDLLAYLSAFNAGCP